METIFKKISEIKVNPNNPRLIKDEKFKKLVQSIKSFPEMLNIRPIVVNQDLVILGGNMRYKACKEAGMKEIPVIIADLNEDQQREFLIKDNTSGGEWDWEMLANEWDSEELQDWGLDLPGFEDEEENKLKDQNKKLSDRFIIPPFSVLDTKQGNWKQRKNYWLSLGIKSEEGRDSMALNFSTGIKDSSVVSGNGLKWSESTKDMVSKIAGKSDGVSIFDPVLCELAYQWFNVPKGKILDPFAGGSVRGIVASKLGFEYLGNDLRREQIEANRINAIDVLKDAELYPVWSCGDSFNIDSIAKGYEADMIFSCPPYADLEVYSDAKEDISNMPYEQFLQVYKEIIRKSCDQLKEDRFAVFVVGDVRDKKGFYQNFVSDTILAFWNCGVVLYNEMILLNSVGNAGMRAAKTFNGGRKVIKVHQNVLVFYKGNPKNIKKNYPELDLSYINEEIESE
jgi:DNA modification methylase